MLINEIKQNLNQTKNWQDKYRQIMLLGKDLPLPTDELTQQDNKVPGCESDVWLMVEWNKDISNITLWSNSKVVKGLLVILLALFNNKSKLEISSVNIEQLFSELDIYQHLSQSRNNGIKAIADSIKQLAQ